MLLPFVFYSLFAGAGEEAREVAYKKMIEMNNAGLNRLAVGMTRAQVSMIMANVYAQEGGRLDNPWQIEKSGDLEVHHYLSRVHPPFSPISVSQATPVVFRNGELVGVGSGFLRQLTRAARAGYGLAPEELTVEQRLEKLNDLFRQGLIEADVYHARQKEILQGL